jgi:hypothetical protein
MENLLLFGVIEMNDMPWIKSYPAGVRWDINITPRRAFRAFALASDHGTVLGPGRAALWRRPGSNEIISPPCEAVLKRIPAINGPDQTTGFDHVGIHPQCNLPPISQKLAVRNEQISPLR